MLSAQRPIENRTRSRRGSYGRVLYNRFRYYDPSTGRYISADPIGQLGGINVYSYARNNPLSWIDPFGLWNYAREYGTTGHGLSPNMSGAEDTVDRVYNDTTGNDATVTYSTNGVHGVNAAGNSSFHYEGDAVDLRTRGLNAAERGEIVARLQDALGPNYQVVDEGNHIHIEYDPPGGPPAPPIADAAPACHEGEPE